MRANDTARRKEYEFIRFVEAPQTGTTTRWDCWSHRDGDLGQVHWYGAWRQYCYFPSENTVFSAGCLKDITDFIKWLMDERRAQRSRHER